MIEEILKNCDEFKNILKEIKSGKPAHSYLFVSEDEFSAKELSRLTAQALLCSDLCGTCENCVKFKAGHPDVKFFPTKDKLLVEESNFIASESFIKPIFADRKMFVIDDFDKSTEEAQNKLLKTLEEPNENMFYLLSTSNPDLVLPTIKSRCFKVVVGRFNEEEIKRALGGNFDELALVLGDGYLGKTLALSKKDDLSQVFDLAKSVVFDLKQSKEVIVYSKKIFEKKDDLELILEVLSIILEDLMFVKTQKFDMLKLKSLRKEMVSVADQYSMKCIAEIEKLIINVKKEIGAYVNPALVIDNFLMGFLEVKYLCR